MKTWISNILNWRKSEVETKEEVPKEKHCLSFSVKGIEYLRIEEDGKFFVRGNEVAEDREVYDSMKAFLDEISKAQSQC